MQQTRDIIKRHQETHESFEYYYSIIEKVENNVSKNPDISIESSKALMEGICKTILLSLDGSVTEAKTKKLKVHQIVCGACERISEKIDLDIEFTRGTVSLAQRLGELRNERGDISHGKAVPKIFVSTTETAKMVMYVTDSILNYILTAYFSIDLSRKDEIAYEKNQSFNDFLDESYELENVCYSRALYDQDYDSYEEQLRDYLDALDESNKSGQE